MAEGECGCGATGKGNFVALDADLFNDMIQSAQRLIDRIEFDVNGVQGKGGNGGLTSDDTIRAAGEMRILLSRIGREA